MPPLVLLYAVALHTDGCGWPDIVRELEESAKWTVPRTTLRRAVEREIACPKLPPDLLATFARLLAKNDHLRDNERSRSDG